jgi:DNA-binding NtrC family response regulator
MLTVKNSPVSRVLVVDDEFLIRWCVAETLEHSGHAVHQADSGSAALELLTDPSVTIDVVLLDFRLPDSNDLSLLARIRQLAPDRPVILMTAYGSPEVTQGARDLGVYDILSKPFEMHDLQALIVEACGGAPRSYGSE